MLNIALRTGIGRPTYQSPTLDRVVPQLGYVPGNVAVISFRANTIKNDACVGEMSKALAYCLSHITENHK